MKQKERTMLSDNLHLLNIGTKVIWHDPAGEVEPEEYEIYSVNGLETDIEIVKAFSNGEIDDEAVILCVSPDGETEAYASELEVVMDGDLPEMGDQGLIKRLRIEIREVDEKLGKLIEFMSSNKFLALDKNMAIMMEKQRLIMTKYLSVLKDRYVFLRSPEIYDAAATFDFGTAVYMLKIGYAVTRKAWEETGECVIKQVPSRIGADVIPKMQSLPECAKKLLMSREDPHISYTDQCLKLRKDGRADSWSPSVSDIFAEDWMVVTD